jgi:ribonuclease HII
MSEVIAGVDEAGRGPLAGPVVAAAVILDSEQEIIGLDDSKKLTEKKRNILFEKISKYALAWAVAKASPREIDKINILEASLLAMRRAVLLLKIIPNKVLIDGNKAPDLPYPTQTIIGGDAKIKAISAASIVAKVTRDQEMLVMDKKYPGYGFAKHKGYPTREHILAIERLGVLNIHRFSFAPVRKHVVVIEE